MRAANTGSAHTIVLFLLVLGVVISFTGNKYQQRQQARQITWQDVSNTMQDVENAKQDLFKSLNDKAGGI